MLNYINNKIVNIIDKNIWDYPVTNLFFLSF